MPASYRRPTTSLVARLGVGDDVVVEALAEFLGASSIPGGFRVSWRLPNRSGIEAAIYRSTTGGGWHEIARVSIGDAGVIAYDDEAAAPGERYGYRLGILASGKVELIGEAWVDAPASPRLWLGSPSPNPSSGPIAVSFALPVSGPATIRVIDITGRVVVSREVGPMGAGKHQISLGARGRLAPGIYVVTLSQETQSMHVRLAVVR